MIQMKNPIIRIFSLLLISFSSGAQSSQTLWNGDFKSLGFFISPSAQVSSIDGAPAVMVNGRVGVSLSPKFAMGGFFQGSVGEIYPTSESTRLNYLDYRSGGAFVEFTPWSSKLVHLTFPILLGVGELDMDNEWGQAGFGEVNVVHVEPQVQLQLNVHRYVKAFGGVGYRWVNSHTFRNMTEQEVRGLTGQVGVKLGLFR